MSTGYGWEGIRQVCATLLGAPHVPERLCGGACLQRGAITSARPLLCYCCYHRVYCTCFLVVFFLKFIQLFSYPAVMCNKLINNNVAYWQRCLKKQGKGRQLQFFR